MSKTVRDELCALYNELKTPNAVNDEALCKDNARKVMKGIREAAEKGEVGVSFYNLDETRGLLELLREAGFYVTAVPTGGMMAKYIVAWDPRYSRYQ